MFYPISFHSDALELHNVDVSLPKCTIHGSTGYNSSLRQKVKLRGVLNEKKSHSAQIET